MEVISSFHSAQSATAVVAQRPLGAAQTGSNVAAGRSCENGSPASCGTPPSETIDAPRTDVGAGAATLKYRHSERASLYIETQDGDVVRLNFSTRESARAEPSHAQAGGASTSETTLTARTSTKLSVRVRGELDADELAAIQDTIDRAGELAERFFESDLNSAFQTAEAFDLDGGELSQVKLRMSEREQLTYSSYGYRSGAAAEPVPMTPGALQSPGEQAADGLAHPNLTPAGLAAPNPSPRGLAAEIVARSDDAAEDVPTAEKAASAAPAAAADEAPAADPPTETASLAENTPTDAAATASGAEGALRAIGGFLGRLMDSFGVPEQGGSTNRLDFSLKVRVLQSSLVAMSEARAEQSEEPESALPNLVTRTLDALAERNRAPVDQVA